MFHFVTLKKIMRCGCGADLGVQQRLQICLVCLEAGRARLDHQRSFLILQALQYLQPISTLSDGQLMVSQHLQVLIKSIN